MSEWDPYEHLMKLTQLVEQLTEAHNKLSAHYEQQMKRVALLEKRVDELETDILMDYTKRT